jgi:hypothetical protein
MQWLKIYIEETKNVKEDEVVVGSKKSVKNKNQTLMCA